MMPSTCGFSVCQLSSSVLVTVMKSPPRNTRATPGSPNRAVASQAGPAAGFAVGVQWHPEYDWRTDAVSRAIFEQFGAAVRAYAEAARLGGVSIAAD